MSGYCFGLKSPQRNPFDGQRLAAYRILTQLQTEALPMSGMAWLGAGGVSGRWLVRFYGVLP